MAVTSIERDPLGSLGPRVTLRAPLARVALWRWRAAFRRDLRRLARVGDHILYDIGLSPGLAAREAAKPFWQA